MQLADRYARWLETATVSEAPPLRPAWEISGVELQMLWFSGEFGREFTTTAGGRVRVDRFGGWNREPGPHFTGTEILMGSARSRGDVVLHWNANEWEAEGAHSPEHEGTILHIFARGAEEYPTTRTCGGRVVPQIILDVTRFEFPPVDPATPAFTACREIFAGLPVARIVEIVEAAAQYRLCRKAARQKRLAEECGSQEALYQGLAEALGYRNNKLPFMLLAQRFPLALLRARREEIEPLLFAGSGFLNATELRPMPGDTRGYLREVWAQWWPHRTEYERLALPPDLWNLRSQRPVNHPQRRVAALAEIVRHWPVLETLARTPDATALRNFFSKLQHPYWDFHYTLNSKRSASRMALVGEERVVDLLLNVFFPGAISAASKFWETYRQLPAADSNQRVKNAIRRLFGSGKIGQQLAKQAMMQQGLLQIYEDFCMACEGNCARCAMPERLSRWEQPGY